MEKRNKPNDRKKIGLYVFSQVMILVDCTGKKLSGIFFLQVFYFQKLYWET